MGAMDCRCRRSDTDDLLPQGGCSSTSTTAPLGPLVAEKAGPVANGGGADALAASADGLRQGGRCHMAQRVSGRKDEGERVGVYESGGHDSSSCATAGSGRRGVSATGFALLVSVTVAAFAVGSWVGPPHRQCPPPPTPTPPPPPEGYATAPPLPSHQEYEPTLQEMMRVKRERAAAMKEVGHAQPAAAGGGESDAGRHVAGAGVQEKRTADGAEGAELDTASDSVAVAVAVAGPNTGEIPGSSDACGEGCRAGLIMGGGDSVASPGGRGRPSVATAATQVEGGDSPVVVGAAEGSRPEAGTAAPTVSTPVSPPEMKEDRSSGSGSRKAASTTAQQDPPPLPPFKISSRRFSSSRTSRDESTTKRRRRRRSGAADIGVTPAAFARTLGSAERSLAGFHGSGDDEQVARAAMSRSAARAACETMVWSESGGLAGSGRGRRVAGEDDDDGCNTDAVWRDSRREAVIGAPSSSAAGGSTRGGDGDDAGGGVKDGADTAAGGGASTRRRGAADFASVSRGQETEQRDAERLPAGCSGLLLSGNDIQASWAGRYVLVDDEDDDERDDGRHAFGSRAPHYYYYCMETPPSPRDAVAEGDGQVSSPDGSGDRGDELLPRRQGSPGGEGRPALQGVSSTGELGLPEVADGGTLCLYWSGADGGRWVLDDDLRLSNGVLGMTEDPAPPEADLAFLNQRHRGRLPQAGVADDGEGGAGDGDRERATRSGFVSEGEMDAGDAGFVEREGGFAGEGGVSIGSGGVGEPKKGVAGGRAPESSMEAAHRAWLLDSPRLQGWVEADDVVVVCETD